jgi:hypothetical protein
MPEQANFRNNIEPTNGRAFQCTVCGQPTSARPIASTCRQEGLPAYLQQRMRLATLWHCPNTHPTNETYQTRDFLVFTVGLEMFKVIYRYMAGTWILDSYTALQATTALDRLIHPTPVPAPPSPPPTPTPAGTTPAFRCPECNELTFSSNAGVPDMNDRGLPQGWALTPYNYYECRHCMNEQRIDSDEGETNPNMVYCYMQFVNGDLYKFEGEWILMPPQPERNAIRLHPAPAGNMDGTARQVQASPWHPPNTPLNAPCAVAVANGRYFARNAGGSVSEWRYDAIQHRELGHWESVGACAAPEGFHAFVAGYVTTNPQPFVCDCGAILEHDEPTSVYRTGLSQQQVQEVDAGTAGYFHCPEYTHSDHDRRGFLRFADGTIVRYMGDGGWVARLTTVTTVNISHTVMTNPLRGVPARAGVNPQEVLRLLSEMLVRTAEHECETTPATRRPSATTLMARELVVWSARGENLLKLILEMLHADDRQALAETVQEAIDEEFGNYNADDADDTPTDLEQRSHER